MNTDPIAKAQNSETDSMSLNPETRYPSFQEWWEKYISYDQEVMNQFNGRDWKMAMNGWKARDAQVNELLEALKEIYRCSVEVDICEKEIIESIQAAHNAIAKSTHAPRNQG